MKIKELIAELSKYDKDSIIYFDQFEDELCPMGIENISENIDGSVITIRMEFI